MSDLRNQASDDLLAIRELQKPGGAFQNYYARRLGEKITALDKSILDDRGIDGEELEAKRNQRWALIEMREMMERDKQACLKRDRSVQADIERG